jgi:hypothetical protein
VFLPRSENLEWNGNSTDETDSRGSLIHNTKAKTIELLLTFTKPENRNGTQIEQMKLIPADLFKHKIHAETIELLLIFTEPENRNGTQIEQIGLISADLFKYKILAKTIESLLVFTEPETRNSEWNTDSTDKTDFRGSPIHDTSAKTINSLLTFIGTRNQKLKIEHGLNR